MLNCDVYAMQSAQYVTAPRANQLQCLNKVLHVSEPDYEIFTESFHLEQDVSGYDCDMR